MADGSGRPIEIVITGGPCSGTSTSMARLSAKLADWGFRVLVVPEVATLLITGGLSDFGALAADPVRFLALEGEFLDFGRALRDRYRSLAAALAPEQVVILYDRGDADIAAYVGPDAFSALLASRHLSMADVRDSYDAVIHLVTAAIGAEAAYTTATNEARRETPAEAAARDARTLDAWVGHPHLRIIDNSTDFEAKLRRTVAAVARIVGIPEPLEIERKYLVLAPPTPAALAALGAVGVEIEQCYLRSDEGEPDVRIRRRGPADSAMHYRTTKVRLDDRTRIEIETVIDATEYHLLRAEIDPARRPIRKTRYCFAHRGAYFELDVFADPPGLVLLEIELVTTDEAFEIPAILGEVREVTSDPRFTNRALARLDRPTGSG